MKSKLPEKCQHPDLFGINWFENGEMKKLKPLHCSACGKTAKEMDEENNPPKELQ